MNTYAVTVNSIIVAKGLTFRDAIKRQNDEIRNKENPSDVVDVVTSMPQMVVGEAAKKSYRN